MRIGIDIDDTMTFIKDDLLEAAINYDKSLGNSGKFLNDNYYVGKRFNWSKEEYGYFMGEVRKQVVNKAKLRPGLIEVLTKLKEMGHEIIIITARSNYYSNNLKELTKEFIKKNNLPIKDIYFDCFQEGKANKCVELGIDLFIDDNVENCLYVNNKNIKTLLFENKHDNLITVNSWKEVLKYIKE